MDKNEIIGTVLIGGALYYLFISKKKVSDSTNPTPIQMSMVENNLSRLPEFFNKIKEDYGIEIAKNVEKIYRLETANFTSGQFLKTFSAGMEAATDSYPYGWNASTHIFEKDKPLNFPTGLLTMNENGTGFSKKFIKFPFLLPAMQVLADFLQRHNNNAGRWFSVEQSFQETYINKLNKIVTKYV